jgi:hypothetical protein
VRALTTRRTRDTLVRARLVGTHRWRRLAEPCVYMLLFLTLAIVLPFAFPCRESGCVAMPDGGLVCKNDSAIAMDLYGAGDGRLRERAVEETMETFTCRQVCACNNASARAAHWRHLR